MKRLTLLILILAGLSQAAFGVAASDATPFPKYNTAFRVTFPIYKNDGTLITGATGLDSEVSIDAGDPADATAEATEIKTSGTYYLDLTAAEMKGSTIAIVVKTSSASAVVPVIVLYPATNATQPPSADASGRVDVGLILGTANKGAAGYVQFDNTSIKTVTDAEALLNHATYGLAKLARPGDKMIADSVTAGALAGETVLADLTKIHGTALTESAGQLAGRFVNFFDQDAATFNVKSSVALVGSNMGTTTSLTGDAYAALTGGAVDLSFKTLKIAGNAFDPATTKLLVSTCDTVTAVTGLTASNLDAKVSGCLTPAGTLAKVTLVDKVTLCDKTTLTDTATTLTNKATVSLCDKTTLTDTVTAVTGLTAANLDAKVSSRAAPGDTMLVANADVKASTLATAANLTTAQGTLTKLETTWALTGATYQFTAKALELSPAGTAPTKEQIRAEMDANSIYLKNADVATSTRATKADVKVYIGK